MRTWSVDACFSMPNTAYGSWHDSSEIRTPLTSNSRLFNLTPARSATPPGATFRTTTTFWPAREHHFQGVKRKTASFMLQKNGTFLRQHENLPTARRLARAMPHNQRHAHGPRLGDLDAVDLVLVRVRALRRPAAPFGGRRGRRRRPLAGCRRRARGRRWRRVLRVFQELYLRE